MSKVKQVLAGVLSASMIVTLMPAVTFAATETDYAAKLTTSDGVAYFDSFEDAMVATNKAENAGKKAVITLNKDADAADLATEPTDETQDKILAMQGAYTALEEAKDALTKPAEGETDSLQTKYNKAIETIDGLQEYVDDLIEALDTPAEGEEKSLKAQYDDAVIAVEEAQEAYDKANEDFLEADKVQAAAYKEWQDAILTYQDLETEKATIDTQYPALVAALAQAQNNVDGFTFEDPAHPTDAEVEELAELNAKLETAKHNLYGEGVSEEDASDESVYKRYVDLPGEIEAAQEDEDNKKTNYNTVGATYWEKYGIVTEKSNKLVTAQGALYGEGKTTPETATDESIYARYQKALEEIDEAKLAVTNAETALNTPAEGEEKSLKQQYDDAVALIAAKQKAYDAATEAYDASFNYEINIDMTVDFAGFTLAHADQLVGGTYAKDITKSICENPNKATKLVFAVHTTTYVCNWTETPENELESRWAVTSVTETCKNCGSETFTISNPDNYIDYYNGVYTFEYPDSEDPVYTATKTIEVETTGYRLVSGPAIVQVAGQNQHKDGKPVVKATIINNATNEKTTVDAQLVLATDKEVEDAAIKVYDEAGEEVSVANRNAKATCVDFGSLTYKATVVDPDGKELKTVYLSDSQAVAKTPHEFGVLTGYQLLAKVEGFASEGAARTAAGKADREVVEITTQKEDNVTTYTYWYWDDVEEIKNAGDGSQIAEAVDIEEYLNADHQFTYRPVFACDHNLAGDAVDLKGDAVTVSPYPNATTKAHTGTEGKGDGSHSLCEEYIYPGIVISYTFTKRAGDTTKTTYTYTGPVENVAKDPADYSHIAKSGTYDVKNQPTCQTEGEAYVICSICDAATETEASKMVHIQKLDHIYGEYKGTTTPTAQAVVGPTVTLLEEHSVTLNTAKTEATVTASCTEDGGVYKYCVGNPETGALAPGGHWVLQSTIPATGHKLVMTIGSQSAANWSENTDEPYNKNEDYTCTVQQQCGNPGCTAGVWVTYHSIAGTNTNEDIYSAVTVVDEERGVDCKTQAKTTYTVTGLVDVLNNPIHKDVAKGEGTEGPHTYVAKKFNWENNFESATADVDCTVDGCPGNENGKPAKDSLPATVTQTTAADGITTFTATYGDKSETKSVYTLKNAKVTYDTAAITDGNLVYEYYERIMDNYGVTTAAQKVPAVTVTINGTVIDNSVYDVEWEYTDDKSVYAYVTWTEEIEKSKAAEHIDNDYAKSSVFKVAANNTINSSTTTITANGNNVGKVRVADGVTTYATNYNKDASYTIATKVSAVTNATVKYAISNVKLEASEAEFEADHFTEQKKIEALDYSLDKVELKDVGTYYVYAQITADGYTAYTREVAELTISKIKAEVYVDNATTVVGVLPKLNVRAVTTTTPAVEINVDEMDLTITTLGGQDLDKLNVGSYRLYATSPNYDIMNSVVGSQDNYVGVLTVLPGQMKDATVTPEATSVTYTGKAQTPAAKVVLNGVELKEKVDYEVAYADNKNVGTATITVTGINNYEGTATANFTIAAKTIAKATVTLAKTSMKYTGKALKPAVKSVVLPDGTKLAASDYTVSYKNNKNVGTATVTVKGKGNYTGSATATFKITKAANTLKVTAVKRTAKAATLKTKAVTVAGIKVTGAQGKVTYRKAKGGSKFTVNKTTGKITIKKGVKAGTYKVTESAQAAGNSNYKKSKVKKAVVTITVK